MVRTVGFLIAALVCTCDCYASDYSAVFSQPECRAELGLAEEALEYARELNREYRSGSRQLLRDAQREAKGIEVRRERIDLAEARDILILQYLNPTQRTRFLQLVFQLRLTNNQLEKALSGAKIELSEEQRKDAGITKSDVTVAQRVAELQLHRERLGVLFSEGMLEQMVGDFYVKAPLPNYRDSAPAEVLLGTGCDFVNTEPLRFLEVPRIQVELELTPDQIMAIRVAIEALGHPLGNGEFPTDDELSRSVRLAEDHYIASGSADLALATHEARQRFADDKEAMLKALEESKRKFRGPKQEAAVRDLIAEYRKEIEPIEKRIWASVTNVLNEQQWIRLKQLLLQSAMQANNLERGLYVVGIAIHHTQTSSWTPTVFSSFACTCCDCCCCGWSCVCPSGTLLDSCSCEGCWSSFRDHGKLARAVGSILMIRFSCGGYSSIRPPSLRRPGEAGLPKRS